MWGAAVLTGVVAVAAPPAGAATSLPNTFGTLAVDSVHGHVFVSSPAASSVSVLDFSGAIVATISGEAGANALLVDGSTLYVSTSNGLDAINTSTLARTATYGAGVLGASRTLVRAGGRIWTTVNDCRTPLTANLASVDTGSGAVVVSTGAYSRSCPILTVNPADTNLLIGFGTGSSPASLSKIDVSSGDAVEVAQARTNLGNLQQVAFAPDGSTFLAASGSPYEFDEYRFADLQLSGVIYPSDAYPNAVAISPANGGVVAAGRSGLYSPDLDVYRLGDPSTRLLRQDWGATADTLYPRGLAFSADGTKLFTVSGDNASTNGTVNVKVIPIGTTPMPPDTSKGYGATAVDPVHQHVFVSSPTAHAIRVFDFNGAPVATILHEAGAASLALAGSTLYVAATGTGVIDAIDTATYARTASYGAGSLFKPATLAVAGGKLWTSSGGDCGSSPSIAGIDPATGTTVVYSNFPALHYCPKLVASPTNPNLLLGFDRGQANVVAIDVSTGTPVIVTQRTENVSNIMDLAFTPDGASFVLANGWPYQITQYRVSDLTPDGVVYPTGTYPNAVATSATGNLLAAGRSAANPAIDVFTLGQPAAPLVQKGFGTARLFNRSLAFSPDGSRVFAVYGDTTSLEGAANFYVLGTGPTPIPTDPSRGFGAIAVDAAHGHVFTSSPTGSAVRAYDLSGALLTTITGEPGAASLLVDGNNLYVAASWAGTIDVIDTTTLTRTASFGGGAIVQPNTLAKAGGKIWTTSGACGSGVQLVAIDPVTGSTTVQPVISGLSTCPLLTASPTDPNALLGTNVGQSSAVVTRLDVSSGAPVVGAQVTTSLGGVKQLAYAPTGTTFYASASTPATMNEYSASTLALVRTYSLALWQSTPTPTPNAVATSAGVNGVVAVGRGNSSNPALDGFRSGMPGYGVLTAGFTAGATLFDRGLAFSPDGSKLFAVAGDVDVTATTSLVVAPISLATTETLAASPTATVKGQPATFTATVGLWGGGVPQSGTVTFKDGATVIGSAPIAPNGTAALTTAALGVGSHPVTATFSGPGYSTVTSASVTETVSKAATTTALASSVNPSVAFAPVTLTPTVTVNAPGAGTPTGTVTFTDGTTTLGTAAVGANGTATLTVSSFVPGPHSLTAAYGGSADNTASTSGALTQTVNQAATTSAVTSSAPTIRRNTTVTFTAVVAAVSPSTGSPSGSVQFYDGTTLLATVSLSCLLYTSPSPRD